MPDFRTVTVKPLTGVFDTLSSKDEIGFGNFRLVKNATTRSTRNRQRGGGWRRLFADDEPYNNQDLHDQLTDRQFFYDQYTDHAMGGGDLAGYNYPYFAPSYTVPGFSVFPPAAGPYCPVYLGEFPSGSYEGCPIFYPFVGFPYELYGGAVDRTFLKFHWKLDAHGQDEMAGLTFVNLGPVTFEAGILGGQARFNAGDSFSTASNELKTGDIKFGFTGWLQSYTANQNSIVIGRWGGAGNREYALFLVNGQLQFRVSNDGTTIASITNTKVVAANERVFFACWHDPGLNTINLKVNGAETQSASHATGVISTSGTPGFVIGYDAEFSATGTLEGGVDSLSFWKNGFPTNTELLALYQFGLAIEYPFSGSSGCNTGYPFYYQHSYLYVSCPTIFPSVPVSGYPYGPGTPIYDPLFSYDYTYCGPEPHNRLGCREAVTMLNEIVTEAGRKLVAATLSRVYELNQSSGNWRILADGLGNNGYTVDQCTCNRVRGVSDTMGGYLLYTNNFDQPMSYFVGDEASGCSGNSLQVITDLDALGISRAGGVVTWKGFAIWFDLTENGSRFGGDVLWSDLEDPNSYIESDTSFAGRSTIAVGETLLAAAELGNWLIFYTDKSIIRCTLVGGEDVFNFERIYQGGNALKYKFSLFNTGDMHGWLGESDIYFLTQFDTRPINLSWVTKAAGMIFKGIVEEDAVYDPINKAACELVTGGFSEEKHEAWLSWPTGESICPTVTLRMNMKFNAADLVDHGFTAFLTFRKDTRPTVGQWIEDMGICPRGSRVATGAKDGDVCEGAGTEVADPPLYIRNPTEDPDLPVHEDSLCARLEGQSMDTYCRDCPSPATFITASAEDFTLKQQEDDILYREILGGNIEAYDGYSCHGEFYTFIGYDSVIQEGSEAYRSNDEKMIKRIQLEAEPWVQATPSPLECELAYGNQSDCMTWVSARTLEFECQSAKTAAQHAADNTRPDNVFNFPVWRRGQYLSARFRISGIGGGGTFSAIHKSILGWGQADSP